MDQMTITLKLQQGAGRESVQRVESELSRKLPADYLQFMMLSNGAEGMIGLSYLILWPIEEIIPTTKAYQVDRFAPGLVLFGTDGGGQAFGFDIRKEDVSIIEIPFIPLRWSEAQVCGKTFIEFLGYLLKRIDPLRQNG